MKIALVCPYFPPIVGGMETFVYELTRRLSKNDRVCVFTSGRGKVETYDKVTVFRLRSIDVQNLPLSLKIPYPIPPSLVYKLTRFDADVIHACGHAFVTSFQAALASQITHKPFVLSITDIGIAYLDYLLIRGIRPIVDSTLVAYVFRQADVVIASNNVTYACASRFNAKEIVIVPQGVSQDEFVPTGGGEYVTFIAARLVPQKGGEVFVRAIPDVLKEVGDAKFMVIGDGFQRSYLEELAFDLGIKDAVEFVGSIPYEQVPSYLSRAEIVVFPSEIPTGLVLLEAAAMRKPIITTRNRWAEDTLGHSPLLIPMRSPQETANAIVRLLENPDERAKIAELCYGKITSERSWDVVASKHLELYDQIVDMSDWQSKDHDTAFGSH